MGSGQISGYLRHCVLQSIGRNEFPWRLIVFESCLRLAACSRNRPVAVRPVSTRSGQSMPRHCCINCNFLLVISCQVINSNVNIRRLGEKRALNYSLPSCQLSKPACSNRYRGSGKGTCIAGRCLAPNNLAMKLGITPGPSVIGPRCSLSRASSYS